MTLGEILDSLFPGGHEVRVAEGLIAGRGVLGRGTVGHGARDVGALRRGTLGRGLRGVEAVSSDAFDAGAAVPSSDALDAGAVVRILGVVEGSALGVDGAIRLAASVLEIARTSDNTPILLLLDSSSQRMSRRDELLGLNEYLAHLAKALIFSELAGHPSIGLLYGHTAAGAFIATGLAATALVALPGATPTVMDLPSMARVTKLSVDLLRQKAATTPVFAPGLENMAKTGGVLEIWDDTKPLNAQLAACLGKLANADTRDRLGQERGGRPKAATVAARVVNLAT